MRALLQRVDQAQVTINQHEKKNIGPGLLILLGIHQEDQEEDLKWLVKKWTELRIFPDKEGRMNLSVQDIEGEVMIISQFTLHAATKKGKRPSFIQSAPPDKAIPLYEQAIVQSQKVLGKDRVQMGEFGAHMDISLINNGPVTIILDSHNKE